MLDRNKQIYDEYVSTQTSYNILAKKYNVSPQRIQFIISDLRTKNLDTKLEATSTKEEREQYKNMAVKFREAGKFALAEKMFKEIVAWDEHKLNHRGEMDALGHLKLTYQAMADKETDHNTKIKYTQLARESIEKAITIGETYPEIPKGAITIQKVHLANLLMDKYINYDGPEKNSDLFKAIGIIDESLKDFPGSEAHKAWALAAKAKALTLVKQYEAALDTLDLAERKLYEGYKEEFAKNDQPELKLNVWLSGIHLTKAAIYKETDRKVLAKHYASSVITINDPTKALVVRKAQAKRLLQAIN